MLDLFVVKGRRRHCRRRSRDESRDSRRNTRSSRQAARRATRALLDPPRAPLDGPFSLKTYRLPAGIYHSIICAFSPRNAFLPAVWDRFLFRGSNTSSCNTQHQELGGKHLRQQDEHGRDRRPAGGSNEICTDPREGIGGAQGVEAGCLWVDVVVCCCTSTAGCKQQAASSLLLPPPSWSSALRLPRPPIKSICPRNP